MSVSLHVSKTRSKASLEHRSFELLRAYLSHTETFPFIKKSFIDSKKTKRSLFLICFLDNII